jgi:HD superfamily phosphohydrolase
MHPFRHTRFTHSLQVAALNLWVGLRLRLDDEDLLRLVRAGLFHDVGHSVESHYGDELLIEWGYPNHEARGAAFVEDASVREIMAERGRLGHIQKLMDTVGYLYPDCRFVGVPLSDEWVQRLVESIDGVEPGGLHLSSPVPIEEVLVERCVMWRDLYNAPRARRAGAAFRMVLREYARHGLITADELIQGTDRQFQRKLWRVWNGREELGGILPAWVGDFLALSHMDFSILACEVSRVAESEAEATRIAREATTLGHKPLIIKPPTYMEKRYRVLVSGVPFECSAPARLMPPEDRLWEVVWYPRS